MQDLTFALRVFRTAPAFAFAAVSTLAIGIGAATAVFSVVDPLLFRALPYPRAGRLVSFGFLGPIDTNEFQLANAYLDWRERQTAFQSVTSMMPETDCDLVLANPLRQRCARVEANFLDVLGVTPALGRNFTLQENQRGAPVTALLPHSLWSSEFGADPQIAGRIITIDGAPVRVAGVLPQNFEMPQGGDQAILLPEQWDQRVARSPNSTIFLRTFARLKDGVSPDQARQRLQPLFAESLQRNVPPELRSEVTLVVRSLRDRRTQGIKTASWMLLAAVLALLLLACANVANLLLARTAARRKEWAMRAVLGAGRVRLARQALVESLLLGVGGGAAGTALAQLLLRLAVALAPNGTMGLDHSHIDQRVLGFALLVSLGSALLFGLAPLLEQPGAKSIAGWRAAGGSSALFRNILVAAQVAISVILLTGASMFGRTLRNLEMQPLGFHPEHVVTASLSLRRSRYGTPQQRATFYRELEDRLARMPGAGVLALSDSVPPGGSMARPYSNMRIAGHPDLQRNGGMVAFRWVTPEYFRAMGIRIVAGRAFDESERSAAETPLILSETLARRMFGRENPVGQQIDLSGDSHYSPVVGVAEDAKNSALNAPPEPEYYRLRMRDARELGANVVAIFRTELAEEPLAGWIRREVSDMDPSLPVAIQTMNGRLTQFESQPRLVAALTGVFAFFAAMLSAVGVYGVVAVLVAQRTREIGVRMALGATPRSILALIQKPALGWTTAGALAGAATALALGRLIRSLLFEVSPQDPASLVAAIAVLLAAAVCAAWFPSRRAANLDPARTLRND